MQSNDVKQRKNTSDIKQNEEKKRREEKHEKKHTEESKNTTQKRCDVKLILSLMSFSVSVMMMWILHEQNSRFTEIKEQYDDLYEKTRDVLKLQSQMSSLQASVIEYDEILSSTTLMTKLRRDITSIHHTSTALLEDQETSSLQYETLNKRFQNVTETCQSRLTAVIDDLSVLKTDSRSARGRVTDHVNSVDGRVRVLSERLQELEDGIKRNTRVLDRTEEEDARRVQDLQDWNSRRFSKLQERLQPVGRLRDDLQRRLEKTVPRVRQWESRLTDVGESVRSMLKVRAQLSETERRLTELTLQVQKTEEKMRREISSQDIMSNHTDPDQKNDMMINHLKLSEP